MALLNQGLQLIRSTIEPLFDTGKLGTGTTALSQSQTDLITPITASSKVTTISGTDKQITVDYALDSATATGNTFTEFANYDSTTALDRIIFTGIVHSADTEIYVKKRYFIKAV